MGPFKSGDTPSLRLGLLTPYGAAANFALEVELDMYEAVEKDLQD